MNDFCELVTRNSQVIKKYTDPIDLNKFYDLIEQLKRKKILIIFITKLIKVAE